MTHLRPGDLLNQLSGLSVRSAYRLISVALVLLAVLLPGTATAAAADETLITMPAGDSSGFVGPASNAAQAVITLHYPVSVADGVDANSLSAVLIQITTNEQADPTLENSFDVAYQAGAEPGSTGPIINVTVKTPATLPNGTFVLQVRIEAPPAAADSAAATAAGSVAAAAPVRSQIVDLKVVRGAAVLAQIAPTVIDQTAPFWGRSNEASTNITLVESGGQSMVNPLTINQTQGLTQDGVVSEAGLHATANPAQLPAGGTRDISISVTGDGPLGTSEGHLRLDAPQLAAPVDLTVQVNRTIWLGWIGIIAAFGVLLGVVVRQVLVKLIEKRQARLSGLEVLDELLQRRSASKDRNYRRQVLDVAETLRIVLEKRSTAAATVTTATATAAAAEKAARDELNSNIAGQVTRLQAIEVALNASPVLPSSVKVQLDLLRSKLDVIRDMLDDDNAAAAAGALDDAETALRSSLGGSVRDWANGRLPLVEAVADPLSPPLPNTVSEQVKIICGTLEPTLKSMATSDFTVAATATLLGQLGQATQQFEQLTNVLCQLPEKMRTILDRILSPADRDRFQTLADGLSSELNRMITGAPAGTARPQDKISEILEFARQTVLAHAVGAEDEVTTLIQSGDYPAAIEKATAPTTPVTSHGALESTARSAPAAQLRRPGAPLVPRQLRSDSVPVRANQQSQLRTHSQVQDEIRRTTADLASANVLLLIGLSVVIIIIAFLVFSPTWTGTGVQVAAVFLWGFAADVTVGGVQTAMAALPKEVSPGSLPRLPAADPDAAGPVNPGGDPAPAPGAASTADAASAVHASNNGGNHSLAQSATGGGASQ